MANNPEAWLVHTSPKSRDDEFHVPYSMEAAIRGRGTTIEPKVGDSLRSIQGDPRTKKYLDKYGDWKLRVIKGGSSDQLLVFSDDVLPSDALQADPSDKWTETRNHPWPGLVRGTPQVRHKFNGGDYGGTSIIIDEIPGKVLPTVFLIEVWWTTESWDQTAGGTKQGPGLRNWLYSNRPKPQLLRFLYPIILGGTPRSRECLHALYFSPPLSGATSMQGRPYNNIDTPGERFERTNHVTWMRHIHEDSEHKREGRFQRIRQTVLPPWAALRYPKAITQYTS
jgi:hypothetical protein